MANEREVLIVGGGLNGPVLALALAASGIASVVLDARRREEVSDPDFDGRAYALAAGSRKLLTALGLWGGLAGKAQPIAEIKISDGRPGEGAGPFFLHFHGQEIDEGPMGHILEDRWLRAALLAAMDAAPLVDYRPGARVTGQSVTAGAVEVALAGGERLAGRLLVACDGKESAVARRAGIGRRGWDYGQTSLVAAVEHARPHGGIAHQFFMPSGPLAILPLPGDRSSIVWTETRARAAAIAAMDEASYLAALRPRFGDFLGPLRLAGVRFSYPIGLSLAERLTAGRVTLVGDAAHGIHPLAGQGLNLGLRDVATLAEVLTAAARRGEDLGSPDVLTRYARWRGFDVAALAAATDGVNRLFSNDNPLLRLGRGLGLKLVGQLPAVRRALIGEAAGLAGDLPQLLRGRLP